MLRSCLFYYFYFQNQVFFDKLSRWITTRWSNNVGSDLGISRWHKPKIFYGYTICIFSLWQTNQMTYFPRFAKTLKWLGWPFLFDLLANSCSLPIGLLSVLLFYVSYIFLLLIDKMNSLILFHGGMKNLTSPTV